MPSRPPDPDQWVDDIIRNLGSPPELSDVASALAAVEDGCVIYLRDPAGAWMFAAAARDAAAARQLRDSHHGEPPVAVVETMRTGLPRLVQMFGLRDALTSHFPWIVPGPHRPEHALVVPLEDEDHPTGAIVVLRWRSSAPAFAADDIDLWRLVGLRLGPVLGAEWKGSARGDESEEENTA